MDKYPFRTDIVRKCPELAEGPVVEANAREFKPRVSRRVNRYRSLLQDKSFSLTIRTDDGRTLLETRVEHLHQAFQRLIDWSVGEAAHDVSAAISGPNGFHTRHRIKDSGDFAWIENDQTSETGVCPRGNVAHEVSLIVEPDDDRARPGAVFSNH
jgi:hypothetical protein